MRTSCEYQTLTQKRRQMCETERWGARGGEGAQESPTGQLPEGCIGTNYRRETEAGMQAGARRGRGRSGKMTKSNLYALASKLL